MGQPLLRFWECEKDCGETISARFTFQEVRAFRYGKSVCVRKD